VELREQLVKKNQRIYELEEKLLAQGEGRAKVEAQLRQLRHQASQMNRDAKSERDWVEKFLRDSGYGDLVSQQGDGDYGTKLQLIFNDKQAQIDELFRENRQLEEKCKLASASMQDMGQAGDDALRAQDENNALRAEIEGLAEALNEAEREREDALNALEQAQLAADQPRSPSKNVAASPAPQKNLTPRAATPRASTPRAAPAPQAMVPAGGDKDITTNMLTQVINELEKKAKLDKAKTEDMEIRVQELERRLEQATMARDTAENVVVALKDQVITQKAQLEAKEAMLGTLESHEQDRFDQARAEERAQHEEEIAKMKQQMAGVMDKVMKEWERVKKAAKKSVSVEEWLRLEDELKRAEKKNEELLSERESGGGGGGGGGGGSAAPVRVDSTQVAPDPDVYGKCMADLIDNLQKKQVALQLHGCNWKAHSNPTSPAEEQMRLSVQRLEKRYKSLEDQYYHLDDTVGSLVEKAMEGQIPEAVVDKLVRAIKEGLTELIAVKEERTSPVEINGFMDQMLKATEALAKGLEESEKDWVAKTKAVVGALEETRTAMQQEIAEMRTAINSVPESIKKQVFSNPFLTWFDRAE